jgi:lipopolysaccharide/colanic/teichoic acid biosynthesis glycosyltransferase
MSKLRISGRSRAQLNFYVLIDILDNVPIHSSYYFCNEVELEPRPLFYGAGAKRALDIVGASILILCCLPVMAVVAAAVAAGGRPTLYRSRRVGLGGEPFDCLKFRTMVPGAEEVLAALLRTDERARAEWTRNCKLGNDPRVTRLGRMLRATSLDELPQLFNVLAGQMSLVGPRPVPRQELNARYGQHAVHYLRVRPGLTGPWQVSGRSDLPYEERVSLDVAYAKAPSLLTDLRILARTAVVVLARKGAR